MDKLPTTQRAYTLRLKGVEEDNSWSEKLWKTHEAVNKGAKSFGDWLLTMRGGLDHRLVEMKVKTRSSERDPNDQEKRDRRIILALSWLSVESEKGAPKDYIVTCDPDTHNGKQRNNWKTVDALKEILKARRVSATEIDQWVKECSASLQAAIRDDAVWVNRSRAFDNTVNRVGNSLTGEEVWDILEQFFKSKESYLKSLKAAEDSKGDETAEEEGAKDLVQKAGGWLSNRFGTGEGADFERMKKVYRKIASWVNDKAQPNKNGSSTMSDLAGVLSKFNPASHDLKGVLGLISGPGYKSDTRAFLIKINGQSSISKNNLDTLRNKARQDEKKCNSKIGNKGERDYANKVLKDVEVACGFTYHQDSTAKHKEFSVMLDHAARRVSLVHTWIKRAEAERQKFEEDAKKLDNIPQNTKEWLDRLCEERSLGLGAIEGYRIRKRAVDGWKDVVKAWSKRDCQAEENRIIAVGAVQAEYQANEKKFGEAELFRQLAIDEAKCVWQQDGKPDPQLLLNYVAAIDAEAKKRRFKVPAYRHPDPLLHPVFCDYGKSRWDIKFDIHEAYKKRGKKNKNKPSETLNVHGLKMSLRTGNTVEKTHLLWQSKLLEKDFALETTDNREERPEVTRASRFGRVVANSSQDIPVRIGTVFDQNDWNGRLQAPRKELDRIARRIEKHGWDKKAISMKNGLKWFVSFSPKLQPQGPWVGYIDNSRDRSPFERKYKSGDSKGQTISLTGRPHQMENEIRKGHARIILSRLPGLRVLSVDLGHRYAAACAVWETMTTRQVKEACEAAGCDVPGNDALYLHLKSTDGKKTTVYRRIGTDTLSGSSHPAPWARLDRQFLIKLQGEEREARKASPAEIRDVKRLEDELGRTEPEKRSLRVDELMFSAVSTVRLALRRHTDRAKIGHYLITDEKILPGGRTEKLDEQGRIKMLTDALEIWYSLATATRGKDRWAENLWNEQSWKDDIPLTERATEDKTRQQIKKEKESIRAKLRPAAERLSKNSSLCMKLHTQWSRRWYKDDTEWNKHLRLLRDWVLPKGSRAKEKSIRNVGGLSLNRLTTIRSLYQVQKAFYTRLKPDGSHETAEEHFGQRILDAMEHMREQRVKQLASRIVEAAIGVGRVKVPKKGKDPKRPTSQTDAPCHAVIIENLTHYRPEETRTRRENRQLMQWSSSKVKKYLSEGCEIHGLYLREVQAGYTSRQDSRTGAPGVRCEDVPVKDFLESPFWKRETARAENKGKNKGNAYERYILKLCEKFSGAAEKDKKKILRIPRRGGEIFVSADKKSPASKGIQADLNAAANIGLRALLDPDFPGRWWYVPCDSKEYKPLKDRVSGSKAFEEIGAMKSEGKKERTKGKDIINLWRDVSVEPLKEGQWQGYSAYQNKVQNRVIEMLCTQYGVNDKP